MSFKPKLVALDIDGTLVPEDSSLSPEIREAVQRVVAADIPVVLSTGRSWRSTVEVFEGLGLPAGWAVVSNGAMVVRNPPFEIVTQESFDPAETIARVLEVAPHVCVAVQRGLEWLVNQEFPAGELEEPRVVSVEELASSPVSRVVIREPNSSEAMFEELVGKLGLHEVSYAVGWSAWLDIAPQGVDKAHGLSRVVKEYGLTAADVLAIGDGRNDIEMLEWAGRGVAMGDAVPEVQAVADHVTDGFADGGTIAELARWF